MFSLPHDGMLMDGDEAVLGANNEVRVSKGDHTSFSADSNAREIHPLVSSRAHDVIDNDEVGALGRLIYFWARSYGLVDRPDRLQRHVILHATRLITAIDPPVELRVRELILKTVTWLMFVERGDDGPHLRAFLLGDDRGNRRVEHAATDLRNEMNVLDLNPTRLEWALSKGPDREDGSVLDRAAQWVQLLLWSLTGTTPTSTLDTVLRLPPHWVVDVNPCAFEVEADIETWLRGVGVIKNEETYRVFQELTVAEYVGWPCPHANHEQLWVVMGFLSLWIFHDDNLEGVGARSPELLARAISGRLAPDEPALSNRYLRGWAELGSRFARVMSDRWLQRHYDRFLEWVNAVGTEAMTLRKYRQHDRIPTVDEYFELRRRTIGTYPTANFLEYFLGVELPDEVVHSSRFGTILDMLADIVSIHNDLFGFSTDTTRRMLNLVVSRVAEGVSHQKAFCELTNLHNAKVQALAEELTALEEDAAADVQSIIQQWTRGVQSLVSGFVHWHALTSRYSDVHRLPDGSIVRVMVSCDGVV